MNGPEHYTEAQRLLALSQDELENYAKARVGSTDEAAHLTQSQWASARAQVHATLALVAATVSGRAIGPLEGWGGHHVELLSPEREAWVAVINEERD